MTKPIHPFPARMAPDIALARLKLLSAGSVVLDPMVGSGTVVRQATDLGHTALGFDTDPLAVLMTKVWTTPVDDRTIERLSELVINAATHKTVKQASLAWMDRDEETTAFVKYWFAKKQRIALRKLSNVLFHLNIEIPSPASGAAIDVLRLALSRIIITKDQGASLARDVSHSRPHKVTDESTFDVMAAFERSTKQIRKLLATNPPRQTASIRCGDARSMHLLDANSVDAVFTSPPYLNAIDYMRGHRLSLVWLGHTLSSLREIRSTSIGTERAPDTNEPDLNAREVEKAMGDLSQLPNRQRSMVSRYSQDLYQLAVEISRVVKPNGQVTFVIGNSCLKGTFISNSNGVRCAASLAGLSLADEAERELPERNRYLPMPRALDGPLGKRIRTETVLTFTA